MIKSLCRKYLGAEWEDGAQEVRMHVFENLHRHRGEAKLSTWLHRVTVNECLQILRKTKKDKCLDSLELKQESGFDAASPEPSALAAVSARQLLVRVRSVPLGPQAKSCIALLAEGLMVKDIAAIHGISVGCAKSYIFRGRLRMRMALPGKRA